MIFKKIYLLIIIVCFYAALMINYPSPWLKSLGYNQGLNLYANLVSTRSSFEIIYNPGLRQLDKPSPDLIRAVTPEANSDFASLLNQYLASGSTCIVECSQLDTWHSTPRGMEYLRKMRPQAYRVIIFDGGHHLPALGLAPDLIIIPRLAGYAVHSYMLDGIKIAQIEKLAREYDCPSIIATIPRMALVKNETSMVNITQRILKSCPVQKKPDEFKPIARTRMSKYKGAVFAYIDKKYSAYPETFYAQISKLGLDGVTGIYLAFDYRYTSVKQAQDYCNQLQQKYNLPVTCVNEPVKVANAFWGGE